MPIVRVPVAGSDLIASASVFKRKTLVVAANTKSTLADLAIQCNNLPNAFFYLHQTAGVIGANFEPYFAVDNTTNAQPNWLPLTPPQAVFLLTPTFVNIRVVATMLSIQITNQTLNPQTFELVVAASQ